MIKRATKMVLMSLAAVLAFNAFLAAPAKAYPYRGYCQNVRSSYGTYMRSHPMAHSMAKDGAFGAAAGAVVGLISHRGLMHGALMGAGAGAGIGALRSSSMRYRHPTGTNVGTAALAGLGLYLSAKHGHGLL